MGMCLNRNTSLLTDYGRTCPYISTIDRSIYLHPFMVGLCLLWRCELQDTHILRLYYEFSLTREFDSIRFD